LSGETILFGAFQFAFEVISISFSFDSANVLIAITVDRFVAGFATFFE